MATLENDSAPQFMDSNQYDQGFVDYGNQPEVDFSSSAPPPLPPKNNAAEPAVDDDDEDAIEPTLDEPILVTLVCFYWLFIYLIV